MWNGYVSGEKWRISLFFSWCCEEISGEKHGVVSKKKYIIWKAQRAMRRRVESVWYLAGGWRSGVMSGAAAWPGEASSAQPKAVWLCSNSWENAACETASRNEASWLGWWQSEAIWQPMAWRNSGFGWLTYSIRAEEKIGWKYREAKSAMAEAYAGEEAVAAAGWAAGDVSGENRLVSSVESISYQKIKSFGNDSRRNATEEKQWLSFGENNERKPNEIFYSETCSESLLWK